MPAPPVEFSTAIRLPFSVRPVASAAGMSISSEKEVRQVEVRLVAGRHQLGQADAPRRSARQQRTQDAAALRHHANAAGRELRHLQRTARRQRNSVRHVHQPDCVGPEQPHAARSLDQFGLPPRSFRAGFGIAARQHDGCACSPCGQLAHRVVRTIGA